MVLDKKSYKSFDKEDVQLMKSLLKQFHDYHQEEGGDLPDFSPDYVAYLPVFAIALLKSQQAIDKLTKRLVWLTAIMALLTVVLIILAVIR